MEREDGYYWVKDADGELLIVQWWINRWWMCGNDCEIDKEEFIEIDERRIERPTGGTAKNKFKNNS